jgi:hypothetical protein
MHKAVTWHLRFTKNTASQFQPAFSEHKTISSSSVKPWPQCSLKPSGWNICTYIIDIQRFLLIVSQIQQKGSGHFLVRVCTKALLFYTPVTTILTKNIIYTLVSHAAILITGLMHSLIQCTCNLSLQRMHTCTHTNTPHPEEPSSILVVPHIICNIFGFNSVDFLSVFPTACQSFRQENEVTVIHTNCSCR